MTRDFFEEFCDSIDYIVSKKMESIDYTSTKTGTIIAKTAEASQYQVSVEAENQSRLAMSLGNDKYEPDDAVVLLFPNNDFNASTVYILRKLETSIEDKPINYSLETLNLIREFPINENISYKAQIGLQKEDTKLSQPNGLNKQININYNTYRQETYDHLGISLDVNSSPGVNQDKTLEIIVGDYGIKLTCEFENEHWEMQKMFKDFLQSAQLYCKLYKEFIPYDTSFEIDDTNAAQVNKNTDESDIIKKAILAYCNKCKEIIYKYSSNYFKNFDIYNFDIEDKEKKELFQTYLFYSLSNKDQALEDFQQFISNNNTKNCFHLDKNDATDFLKEKINLDFLIKLLKDLITWFNNYLNNTSFTQISTDLNNMIIELIKIKELFPVCQLNIINPIENNSWNNNSKVEEFKLKIRQYLKDQENNEYFDILKSYWSDILETDITDILSNDIINNNDLNDIKKNVINNIITILNEIQEQAMEDIINKKENDKAINARFVIYCKKMIAFFQDLQLELQNIIHIIITINLTAEDFEKLFIILKLIKEIDASNTNLDQDLKFLLTPNMLEFTDILNTYNLTWIADKMKDSNNTSNVLDNILMEHNMVEDYENVRYLYQQIIKAQDKINEAPLKLLNNNENNIQRLNEIYTDIYYKLIRLLSHFNISFNSDQDEKILLDKLLFNQLLNNKNFDIELFENNSIYSSINEIYNKLKNKSNNEICFLNDLITILKESNKQPIRQQITKTIVDNKYFQISQDLIYNFNKTYYIKQNDNSYISFNPRQNFILSNDDKEDIGTNKTNSKAFCKELSQLLIPSPFQYYQGDKQTYLYELIDNFIPAKEKSSIFNNQEEYYTYNKYFIISKEVSLEKWQFYRKIANIDKASFIIKTYTDFYYKKSSYINPNSTQLKLNNSNYYLKKNIFLNCSEEFQNQLQQDMLSTISLHTNKNAREIIKKYKKQIIESLKEHIENGDFVYYRIKKDDLKNNDYDSRFFKSLDYIRTNDSISLIKNNIKEKKGKNYFEFNGSQFKKISNENDIKDDAVYYESLNNFEGFYYPTQDNYLDITKQYFIKNDNAFEIFECKNSDKSDWNYIKLAQYNLYNKDTKLLSPISSSSISLYENISCLMLQTSFLTPDLIDENYYYYCLNKVEEIPFNQNYFPDKHILYIKYEGDYPIAQFRSSTQECNLENMVTILEKKYISVGSLQNSPGNLLKTLLDINILNIEQQKMNLFISASNTDYEVITNYKDLIENKVYVLTSTFNKVQIPDKDAFNNGYYYVLNPIKRIEKNNTYLMYKFLTSTFIEPDLTINIDHMRLFLRFITSSLGRGENNTHSEVFLFNSEKMFGDLYNFVDGQYRQEYYFPIKFYGKLKRVTLNSIFDKDSFKLKSWVDPQEFNETKPKLNFNLLLNNIRLYLANNKTDNDLTENKEQIFNNLLNYTEIKEGE